MFKVQEHNSQENYHIITFTDGSEAYGALIILDEEKIYLEFMEFDGEEIVSITEEEYPEEFKRLEETYINNILRVFK